MRLRILELPSEAVGSCTSTPFAVVLDDVTEALRADEVDSLAALHPKTVLVFRDRIELDGDRR